MTELLTHIRRMYSFNRWANGRTLAAAESLAAELYTQTLGGGFPSLRATLEHLLAAEVVWLSRWRGTPLGNAPDLSGCSTPKTLRPRWERLWNDQGEFLDELLPADLDRKIDIRLRNGTEALQPLNDTLIHVINHATYHRGQAADQVRRLGGAPAVTDYFLYCMAREAGDFD